MYVGGKQARPDGGYSQPVYSKRGKLLGHAGIGNRKDIRNAVEAARGAKRMGEGHRAPARADPLLHRREPLGPRRRVRQRASAT
jgi:aldehyde dehydrogenase (NAD+)